MTQSAQTQKSKSRKPRKSRRGLYAGLGLTTLLGAAVADSTENALYLLSLSSIAVTCVTPTH